MPERSAPGDPLSASTPASWTGQGSSGAQNARGSPERAKGSLLPPGPTSDLDLRRQPVCSANTSTSGASCSLESGALGGEHPRIARRLGALLAAPAAPAPPPTLLAGSTPHHGPPMASQGHEGSAGFPQLPQLVSAPGGVVAPQEVACAGPSVPRAFPRSVVATAVPAPAAAAAAAAAAALTAIGDRRTPLGGGGGDSLGGAAVLVSASDGQAATRAGSVAMATAVTAAAEIAGAAGAASPGAAAALAALSADNGGGGAATGTANDAATAALAAGRLAAGGGGLGAGVGIKMSNAAVAAAGQTEWNPGLAAAAGNGGRGAALPLASAVASAAAVAAADAPLPAAAAPLSAVPQIDIPETYGPIALPYQASRHMSQIAFLHMYHAGAASAAAVGPAGMQPPSAIAAAAPFLPFPPPPHIPSFGAPSLSALSREISALRWLGRGGGGTVLQGVWQGAPVAVKFMLAPGEGGSPAAAAMEGVLSSVLNHPNVVHTYAFDCNLLSEAFFAEAEAEGQDSGLGTRDLFESLLDTHALYGTASPTATACPPRRGPSRGISRGASSLAMAASAAAAGGAGFGGAGPSRLRRQPISAAAALEATREDEASREAPASGDASASGQASERTGSGAENRQQGRPSVGPLANTETSEGRLRGGGDGDGCSGEDEGSESSGEEDEEPAGAAAVQRSSSASDRGCFRPRCDGGPALGGKAGEQAPAPVPPPQPQHQQQPEGPAHPAGVGTVAGSHAAGQGGTAAAAAAAAAAPPMGAAPAPAGLSTWLSRPPHAALESTFQSDEGFGDPDIGASRRGWTVRQVLSYLRARPGMHMTHIIMEYCDRGSLLSAIKRGVFRLDAMPADGPGGGVGGGAAAAPAAPAAAVAATAGAPRFGRRIVLRALLRTARDVAQGMCHLHANGIIHGDLKPGNVLLRGCRSDRRGFVAMVADFGLSKVTYGDKPLEAHHWSTLTVMAPEVIAGRWLKASDVFSFGMLLWQLVTSEPVPYGKLTPPQILMGVSSGTLKPEWPPSAHPALVRLGRACLATSPEDRPSFGAIVKVLTKIEKLVREELRGQRTQQLAAARQAARA